MSLGSIPVIIWENWKWLPYESELDWTTFAVIAEGNEMAAAKSRINAMTDDEIRAKQQAIERLYPEWLTYKSVRSWITKQVSSILGREEACSIAKRRSELRF